MKEITCEELKALAEGSYVLIDIRDEGLCSYGMIPGAVNIPRGELEHSSELLKSAEDKKLILPLTAIKNISSNTSNIIVENKPYSDYFDFFKKTYNDIIS